MPHSNTSATRLAYAQRAAEALELRKRGMRFREIGSALQCSEKKAWRIVSRELRRLNERRTSDAEALRQLESERLNSLLAAVWPKAQDGDLGAVGVALSISARISKLYGLDAATKFEEVEPVVTQIVVREQIVSSREELQQLRDAEKNAKPDRYIDHHYPG